MKKLSLIFIILLLVSSAFAQNCYTGPVNITPHTWPTPGFEPPSDSLPCITQGTYVHDTIYFTNFTAFAGQAVDSLTFDSIGNLPAGLCWTTNKATNSFYGGENGVIYISGYTTAPAGQYSLQMFITAWASGIIIGPDANFNSLSGLYYYLRVACSNGGCTPVDTLNGPTHAFIADSSCSSYSVTINPNGSTTFCAGNSLLLTASTNISGASYHWSNGDVNQTITVSATGTYTVTVYNATDTAVSQPIGIVVNTCSSNPGGPGFYPSSEVLPCLTQGAYVHDTITFVNYTSFNGVNVDSMTFDSIGNLPTGLSWSTNMPNNTWAGGDSGLIFISGYTSASAGQYTLGIYIQAGLAGGITIPANTSLSQLSGLYYWLRLACNASNCMSLDTIGGKTHSYIIDTLCSGSPYVTVNPSGSTTFCNGGSVTLTAITNITGATYNWTGGYTTQSLTVTTSGVYSVTVTNGTNTAISQPITVVADSCTNYPGGPGFYPSSLTVPCITAGAYVHDTITYINYTTFSGVIVDSLIFDSIGNLPAGLSWSTNMPNNLWATGDTGLIFISGYTSAAAGQYSLGLLTQIYLSGGIVTPVNTSLESLANDYYWLRVACSNSNCTPVDTINGKTAPFIADTACSAAFAISISGPNAMCGGGSVTLSANSISNVSTYSWSDGETTQSITVSPSVSSTYSVTATGSSATATASTYITVYPAPVAMFSITPDSTPHVWNILNQCSGTSLTYTWTWGDGSITTTTNPTLAHTYDSAGYYTVCVSVTEPVGCSASYCDSGVYLFKDQSGQMIQLNVIQYPAGINPISESTQQISYYGGAVHFSEAVTAPASVRLYDMSGREVMTQDGFIGTVMPINNSFAQGVYIIHIQNSSYSISRKLPILQ